MTREEKTRVSELHRQGCSYKEISRLTRIPIGTIKSFCHRNPLEQDIVLCRQCGKEVTQTPGTRRKIWCSTSCRLTWWNAHPDEVQRKTKTHTCPQCGQSFETHVDKRKYCSRACYAAARRRGASA